MKRADGSGFEVALKVIHGVTSIKGNFKKKPTG
jgi:hypothetical protein